MTEPTFKAIPMLRVFDLAKAKEFYVDFLGMSVDWEHRYGETFPVYLQVSRGDLVLHLTEHHGDACPGAAVFVRTKGVAAFHREVTAKAYAFCRPGLEDQPWGRCMEVIDPFGNRLRFSESAA